MCANMLDTCVPIHESSMDCVCERDCIYVLLLLHLNDTDVDLRCFVLLNLPVVGIYKLYSYKNCAPRRVEGLVLNS